MSLKLDDILNAEDTPREKLDVPEWGGEVWVRCLPSMEKDRFDTRVSAGGKVNLENFKARLVAYCLCDEDGHPLCVDPEKDAESLGRKSGPAITRLYRVAARLNRMRDEDIEDARKNS
jgi:hypothetical protein